MQELWTLSWCMRTYVLILTSKFERDVHHASTKQWYLWPEEAVFFWFNPALSEKAGNFHFFASSFFQSTLCWNNHRKELYH